MGILAQALREAFPDTLREAIARGRSYYSQHWNSALEDADSPTADHVIRLLLRTMIIFDGPLRARGTFPIASVDRLMHARFSRTMAALEASIVPDDVALYLMGSQHARFANAIWAMEGDSTEAYLSVLQFANFFTDNERPQRFHSYQHLYSLSPTNSPIRAAMEDDDFQRAMGSDEMIGEPESLQMPAIIQRTGYLSDSFNNEAWVVLARDDIANEPDQPEEGMADPDTDPILMRLLLILAKIFEKNAAKVLSLLELIIYIFIIIVFPVANLPMVASLRETRYRMRRLRSLLRTANPNMLMLSSTDQLAIDNDISSVISGSLGDGRETYGS